MIQVTSNYYDNMVKIIDEIEQASATIDVQNALEVGNEILGVVLEDLDIERISQLQESIEDKYNQVDV